MLGRSGLLEKGFQMPGEDLVKGLLFRFAATVLGWADRCDRHGAAHTAMGGPPVLASLVFRDLLYDWGGGSARECEDFHPPQVRPATAGRRILTLCVP